MKTKKLFYVIAILFGFTIILSTSCTKEEDNDDDGSNSCSGYISAKATGEVNADYCLDKLTNYDGTELSVANQSNSTYNIFVKMINGLKVGTFNCDGSYNSGYIELNLHGNTSEFYGSKSGTLTITKVDQNTLEGTFDVTCKGYNNKKDIHLVGKINYRK